MEIRRRKFGRSSWPAYRRWLLAGAGRRWPGDRCSTQACASSCFRRASLLAADRPDRNHRQSLREPRTRSPRNSPPDLGKSIVRVPLDARREALESIPWVEQASVAARAAQPHSRRNHRAHARGVPAHRQSSSRWWTPTASFWIGRSKAISIFRWSADSTRPCRVPIARSACTCSSQFMKEIELAQPGAGDQVSEVDLSDAQDLRATLAGLPGLEEQAPVAGALRRSAISATSIVCCWKISTSGAPARGASNRWTCDFRGRWWSIRRAMQRRTPCTRDQPRKR